MTIEQALLAYNSRLTNEILFNKDFVRASATGKTAGFINSAESYELTRAADRVTFTKYGTNYYRNIDEGTPAGTKVGLEALLIWIKAKPLRWKKGKSEDQLRILAGQLSEGIEEFGSLKAREPRRRTTIFDDALKNSEKTLFDKLNEAHRTEVDAQITRMVNDKI